jgi:hypothetical protein
LTPRLFHNQEVSRVWYADVLVFADVSGAVSSSDCTHHS